MCEEKKSTPEPLVSVDRRREMKKHNAKPTPLISSMRANQTWLKCVAKIGLLLMMGASMSVDAGLFGIGGSTMSWKEEAQLHDGGILVVERFYNLGGRPTLESRERAALDETVTFSHPATGKRVIWKTDFRDSIPDASDLNLILLDIVEGVPYIAAYPTACIAYNKWKRPNPPQILFKYEGEQWKRITLAEFPVELTRANVIVGRPAASLLKPFYTVAQVNEENRDISTPEYKTVLREALPHAGAGCPELVRVEGGWVSPGGGKSPIPIGPRKPSDVKK